MEHITTRLQETKITNCPEMFRNVHRRSSRRGLRIIKIQVTQCTIVIILKAT